MYAIKLPELVSMMQLGYKRADMGRVEEALIRVFYLLETPLLNCSGKHLHNARERAPLWQHLHVNFSSHKVENARKKHQDCWDCKAYRPTDGTLNIDYHCCRDHHGTSEGKVIPEMQ